MPAETGGAIEETAIETLTPAPQPTAKETGIPLTPTPSLTATFTPYPTPAGLLTHEELEQRMQDWISGKIQFADENRILDKIAGEELRLGVLGEDQFAVTFVFYNLGFSNIQDENGSLYQINLVGFEDGQGNRFTVVFHNGRMNDEKAIIRLLKWRGRRIGYQEKISFEQLPPEEFAGISPELPMSVFVGSTWWKYFTGREEWNNYLIPAADTTKALTDFLLCDECTVQDVPPILEPVINAIPAEFNPATPYFFDYDVSYW